MAKLSVIVPNYNHARYLPARLDSILGQTRDDFELLILDDCSPDGSRDIIRAYAARDQRIRFHFNEANVGNTFLQWIRGLEMTSGDHVWIAESDDVAAPTLLAELSAAMDADDRVGLAVANTVITHGDEGNRIDYFSEWERDGLGDYDLSVFDRSFRMNGRDYCARLMVPWNTIPNASGVLFRRSALAAAGGPVTDMKLCGDWMTYCRVLMHADIARVATPLNIFRRHAATVTGRYRLIDYVEEAVTVHRYVAGELGSDPNRTIARVRHDYANAAIAAQRRPQGGKIPPRLYPAALREAARIGPVILREAGRIMARELAAGTAARLGLRGKRARG